MHLPCGRRNTERCLISDVTWLLITTSSSFHFFLFHFTRHVLDVCGFFMEQTSSSAERLSVYSTTVFPHISISHLSVLGLCHRWRLCPKSICRLTLVSRLAVLTHLQPFVLYRFFQEATATRRQQAWPSAKRRHSWCCFLTSCSQWGDHFTNHGSPFCFLFQASGV